MIAIAALVLGAMLGAGIAFAGACIGDGIYKAAAQICKESEAWRRQIRNSPRDLSGK